MSSSPGTKIAVGIAAALLLVIVLYTRSGHQPGETGERAGSDEPAARQVEQRLQQLHDAHDRTSREDITAGGKAGGGKIQARTGVAPNGSPMTAPRGAVGQAAPAVPETSGAPEAAEHDLDVDPDDLPALKNIALKDTDPERRLAAVTMLGASEDADALPVLSQALSDEDDEVRMAAIQSLSDFAGDAPVDLLSKVVVDDPSADNRYEALQALSDIGGDRAVAAMQKALNDPDEDVRSLAEGMLDMEETFQDNSQDTVAGATPGMQQPPAQ